MVIIYIHHAKKLFPNATTTEEYGWDAGITEDGIADANSLGIELVKFYGYPSIIYCSPFKRTRETLNALFGCLDEIKVHPVYCDVRVGEYLGNWQPHQIKVTPETASYKPPIEEMKGFESRVKEHHKELMEYKSSEVIWVITHGLVMKKVTKLYSTKIKEVPELGYFVIRDKTLTLKY